MIAKLKDDNVLEKRNAKQPFKHKTSLKNGCSETLSQQQKRQTKSAEESCQWVINRYRDALQRLADE
jgi:hypothetical protein